jgi:hypothetical protein
MITYGTPGERAEKRLIKAKFTKCEIIDPGKYEDSKEKQRRGMKYCLQLVLGCDALVFSKWHNTITAGVGKEINYALRKGIPVYELRGRRLSSVHKRVAYLPRSETRQLYRAVGVQ